MTPSPKLTDRYADNDGVKIHYMAAGSGPLVVFIHGFPDFWYTWRHQIDALLPTHSIAAMDTRGYNLSDAPAAEDAYAMDHLVKDVAAVILTEEHTTATIVGHDWGGTIGWAFARAHPEMTDRLVIINMPHPDNIAAAIQQPGSSQASAFAYAADFRQPGSEANLDAHTLAGFTARTEEERQHYIAAFERSDFTAMMNYYRMNSRHDQQLSRESTPITAPVLQIHGLQDPTLLAESLNNTWDHLTNTWTLLTLPDAGHNAHHDQPNLISQLLHDWLHLPETTTPTATLDPSAAGCCAVTR